MARYYHKETKTEVIEGVHDIEAPGVVELPEDHIFFRPIPEGKELVYGPDGLPTGYQDITVEPPTPTEKARETLAEDNINNNTITESAWRSTVKRDRLLAKVLEKRISEAAQEAGADPDKLVSLLLNSDFEEPEPDALAQALSRLRNQGVHFDSLNAALFLEQKTKAVKEIPGTTEETITELERIQGLIQAEADNCAIAYPDLVNGIYGL